MATSVLCLPVKSHFLRAGFSTDEWVIHLVINSATSFKCLLGSLAGYSISCYLLMTHKTDFKHSVNKWLGWKELTPESKVPELLNSTEERWLSTFVPEVQLINHTTRRGSNNALILYRLLHQRHPRGSQTHHIHLGSLCLS